MQSTTDQVIQNSMQEATLALTDNRRKHGRRPYFRRIAIINGNTDGTKLTAFSRDLPPSGGLLCNAPLARQRVTMTIPTIAGHEANVESDIKWCRPCGSDWFLSGARLINLSALDSANLRMAAVWSGVNRRFSQRLPFYRPILVELRGPQATTLSAISRDISPLGIGLVHKKALETQSVFLTIDQQTRVAAEIRWCKPCSSGMYLSGGRFITPLFEQLPSLLM